MNAAAERLEFAPPAAPGVLRALVLALLAHALLLSALTWGVQWKRDRPIDSVEAELWAAVPQEAAAPEPIQALPPAPPEKQPEPVQPVQPPPAPAPVVEPPKVDIALEREKLRLQKQKQMEREKQLKMQQDKLRQELLRQEQLKAEKLKQAQDKKKTEQETKRLETQRQENLKRMTGMAGASGSANATGSALKSSGPSPSYAGRIRARIKPNIVFTQDLAGNPTAEVEVRTAPDGTIVGRKITQTSGVKEWDDAVLKAIDKTQVLPRDLDGRVPPVLVISFRPKD